MFAIILFFGSISVISSNFLALKPPFWGNNPIYSVSVNLTNPQPISYWKFDYFFDNSRFGFPVSRYNHYPPQFDEMCVDPALPNSSHECDVIYATDGWTYLAFPDVDFCCKCENTFGSTRYDWLQLNSTFEGYSSVNGYTVEHWTKWGQYLNHYYCDSNDRKPIRFNELWGPNHVLKQWDFIVETYNTSAFDEKLVKPPENCQNYCDSEVCKLYRKI